MSLCLKSPCSNATFKVKRSLCSPGLWAHRSRALPDQRWNVWSRQSHAIWCSWPSPFGHATCVLVSVHNDGHPDVGDCWWRWLRGFLPWRLRGPWRYGQRRQSEPSAHLAGIATSHVNVNAEDGEVSIICVLAVKLLKTATVFSTDWLKLTTVRLKAKTRNFVFDTIWFPSSFSKHVSIMSSFGKDVWFERKRSIVLPCT